MSMLTHLYGIYRLSSPGGSVRISEATPAEVLACILLSKDFIDRLEQSIANPQPSRRKPSELKELLEDCNQELDELWDYYLGKLRHSKTSH